MKSFFRNLREKNLGRIGRYLIYALGEILLIIIGILIAVNINERQTNKKNNILRCQYLEELSFSIVHDMKDVEENIDLFEERNNKIKKLLDAIKNNYLLELDSISDKINTLNGYVYFVQQSKSKIEELKYSNINLITNRSLKNKILFYQESKVMPLLRQEKRFFNIHEKVQNYFDNKFYNVDLKELEKDRQFFSIASQKYDVSEGMKSNYEFLLKDLNELKELISLELMTKCDYNK